MFSDMDFHPLMRSETCKSIFFNNNNGSNSNNQKQQVLDDWEIVKSFRDFSFPAFSGIENIDNPPTSLAQPLILIQSFLLFDKYRELLHLANSNSNHPKKDEHIVCMLGHSLGEFTALAACGGVSIEEAIKLVNVRGISMERNITKEQEINMAMIAIINVPPQLMGDIEKYLISTSTNNNEQSEFSPTCCDIANINTPQQIVLSGLKSDIDKQISTWQDGYKCKLRSIPLNVHLPFHSRYLEPVSFDLSKVYEEIVHSTTNNNNSRTLQFPIVANVNAKFIQNFEEMVRLSIHQVHKPVLWNLSIQSIVEHVTSVHEKDHDETTTTTLRFIEFGPQKKLQPMISKCCASNTSNNNLTIESLSFTTMTDIKNYFNC